MWPSCCVFLLQWDSPRQSHHALNNIILLASTLKSHIGVSIFKLERFNLCVTWCQSLPTNKILWILQTHSCLKVWALPESLLCYKWANEYCGLNMSHIENIHDTTETAAILLWLMKNYARWCNVTKCIYSSIVLKYKFEGIYSYIYCLYFDWHQILGLYSLLHVSDNFIYWLICRLHAASEPA